ncbi:MAG: hypothetical protein OEU09_19395, partial [Rhodospirillales bacterium]|nr:hypothetical protein [Rhodospirillales bacterium]
MSSRLLAILLAAIILGMVWPVSGVYSQDEPLASRSMTGLKVLTLRANDIIYDPVSQRIYASVSAFAPPDVAN